MLTLGFTSALFLLQFVFLFFAIFKNNEYEWKRFFTLNEILLIGMTIFTILYKYFNKIDLITNYLVSYFSSYVILGYLIFLIIGILLRYILRKKLIKSEKKVDFHKQVLVVALFLLLVFSWNLFPVIKDYANRKKCSKIVLSYVNEKYKDDKYKITNIYNEKDAGLACLDQGCANVYDFTIKGKNTNKEFIVYVDVETRKLLRDSYYDSEPEAEDNY